MPATDIEAASTGMACAASSQVNTLGQLMPMLTDLKFVV